MRICPTAPCSSDFVAQRSVKTSIDGVCRPNVYCQNVLPAPDAEPPNKGKALSLSVEGGAESPNPIRPGSPPSCLLVLLVAL